MGTHQMKRGSGGVVVSVKWVWPTCVVVGVQ